MDVNHEPTGDGSLYARVFGRPPIYDIVLSYLEPRSLIWLALACRVAYAAVAEFKSRAYNVNRHFLRYFSNPIAFRSLQAKTNTLVSGSDALQFLDRSFYPESDLDLYTHPGHSFEVAQFLVEAEGYQYTPRDDDDDEERDWKVAIQDDWDGTQPRVARGLRESYPLEGINDVWTFTKSGTNQETLKVQIIEANSSPVEAILDFHSTCVMNFISSDAAYSLYPTATFTHRSSLSMPTYDSQKAIQKYIRRGWRFYFVPAPDDLASPTGRPFYLEKVRWVGDKLTWVVPLDQAGVSERPPFSRASAPLTFDPVRCNGWSLRPKALGPSRYECHSYKVQTTVFRYNYAIPDEALSFAIRRWAHLQGKTSHVMVAKEDWVWFDSDIPGFLRTV